MSICKINSDGTKEWINEKGELHREDGPAREFVNGTKVWYINGLRHRKDGPAIEHGDGYRVWYLHGKCHREDGPAIYHHLGYKEWWINDEMVSEKYIESLIALSKETK